MWGEEGGGGGSTGCLSALLGSGGESCLCVCVCEDEEGVGGLVDEDAAAVCLDHSQLKI